MNETFVGAAKTPQAEAMQQALVLAEKAVDLEPSSASHTILGLVYVFSLHPEKALSEAEKAVVLSPNSAAAYHCMGAALMLSERFDEAINMFQKSLRLSPIPHSSSVLTMLGSTTGLRDSMRTRLLHIREFSHSILTTSSLMRCWPARMQSSDAMQKLVRNRRRFSRSTQIFPRSVS